MKNMMMLQSRLDFRDRGIEYPKGILEAKNKDE
jgi:hypothetical protein